MSRQIADVSHNGHMTAKSKEDLQQFPSSGHIFEPFDPGHPDAPPRLTSTAAAVIDAPLSALSFDETQLLRLAALETVEAAAVRMMAEQRALRLRAGACQEASNGSCRLCRLTRVDVLGRYGTLSAQ